MRITILILTFSLIASVAAGESNSELVIVGVPIGQEAGFAKPSDVNDWARAAGLKTIWTLNQQAQVPGRIADYTTYPRIAKDKQTMLDAFKEMNGIDDVRKIQPGAYTAPFLFSSRSPHIVSGAKLPLGNGQATLHVYPDALKGISASINSYLSRLNEIISSDQVADEGALVDFKGLADPRKPALQFIQMTKAQAASFMQQFPEVKLEAGSWGIEAELSEEKGAKTGFHLAAEDEVALRAALNKQKVKKPVLLVLDDSWPRDQEFTSGVNFFCAALDKLYAARPSIKGSPCTEQLKSMKGTGKPAGFDCLPGQDCRTHAEKIRQSLTDFENYYNPGDPPVNVYYIPFNVAQNGANDLLSAIIAYHAAVIPDGLPRGLQVTSKDTSEIFHVINDYLQNKLEKKIIVGQKKAPTNLILFNALLTFARGYSMLEGVPVFINVSWTYSDNTALLADPSIGYNFVFAAAGNGCKSASTKDNIEKPCDSDYVKQNNIVQFLHKSADSHHYVAVMNLDANGSATCNSTRVRNRNFAFGFSGSINGDCGTSFSAPRVAWLFAAREGLRRSNQLKEQATQDLVEGWNEEVIAEMDSFRKCSDDELINNFSCLQISPRMLFKDL